MGMLRAEAKQTLLVRSVRDRSGVLSYFKFSVFVYLLFKTREGHWGIFDSDCKSLGLEYPRCLMLFTIRPP